jgi:hypothetical protein
MNKPEETKKFNVTALVATVVFLGTVIYLSMVMGINDRMEHDLKKQKLKSELLLSERLAEEKKNSELSYSYKELEEKYNATILNLDKTLSLVSRRDGELRIERSGIKEALIEKQESEINNLGRKIKRDSVKTSKELFRLNSENSELKNAVASSEKNSEQFQADLSKLNQLRISSTSVIVSKKNNRQTIKASKSKTITVRLGVSENINDLDFKIFDPTDKSLPVNEKNLSWKRLEKVASAASKSSYVNPELQTSLNSNVQEIEMIYRPEEKLPKGNYKILVYTEGQLMGSVMTRLE